MRPISPMLAVPGSGIDANAWGISEASSAPSQIRTWYRTPPELSVLGRAVVGQETELVITPNQRATASLEVSINVYSGVETPLR